MNNPQPPKKRPDIKFYWILAATLSLLLLLTGIYHCSWKTPLREITEPHLLEDEKSVAVMNTHSCIVKGKTEQEDLVSVCEVIPSIQLELKYASDDNFLKQKIYDDDNAYLRRGTAQKLKKVQDELEQYGYSLKIWDAYRTVEAQYKLWEICPDERFVADPYKGYSNHSRGAAVDVTLVHKDGKEFKMPSDFDEFGPHCDRDYSDVDSAAASNAMLLEKIMIGNGFSGLETEWWHFDDIDVKQYPVIINEVV